MGYIEFGFFLLWDWLKTSQVAAFYTTYKIIKVMSEPYELYITEGFLF